MKRGQTKKKPTKSRIIATQLVLKDIEWPDQLFLAPSLPLKKGPHIQLFRERLSEKVHVAIPKSVVGGFEFTLLQRNLKEWHERPWAYVCEC